MSSTGLYVAQNLTPTTSLDTILLCISFPHHVRCHSSMLENVAYLCVQKEEDTDDRWALTVSATDSKVALPLSHQPQTSFWVAEGAEVWRMVHWWTSFSLQLILLFYSQQCYSTAPQYWAPVAMDSILQNKSLKFLKEPEPHSSLKFVSHHFRSS